MRTNILVDNYDPRIFIVLLILLMLMISDAYLTLTLVKTYKTIELNPIMALYLANGSILFFLAKFLLTSVAVVIFCIFNRFAFARISMALTIIIYLGLVCYELSLLSGFFK